mmetsp:Transcript_18222/g.31750  ORF Transcript_18222/g.31750 Transcript_18222/m.31750 type:complete len:98 (+) Transcript_18222:104-397(+)
MVSLTAGPLVPPWQLPNQGLPLQPCTPHGLRHLLFNHGPLMGLPLFMPHQPLQHLLLRRPKVPPTPLTLRMALLMGGPLVPLWLWQALLLQTSRFWV